MILIVQLARRGGNAHVMYTTFDWRLDVLDTGQCLHCHAPAIFHAAEIAECRRCGRWFDGLLCGAFTEDPPT